MSDLVTNTYRRDVDGLRGLSILMVVLFHATGSLRGGFIGVDVFFVISGFLITGILLREISAGEFSFAAFWERRIRRIMPASVVIITINVGLAYLILMPEDLMDLGTSLRAQSLMVSNFHFWQHSDYFAAASNQTPLLHTWSLSVEEQFYLLFPFICAASFLWKIPKEALRGKFLLTFSLFMLSSLVWSIWETDSDPTQAFYLLPSRAWEFLLGSCLACLPATWVKAPRRLSQTIATLGLVLILGSAFQLREQMPFPGWLAIPPCVGAAMLIYGLSPQQEGTRIFWLRRILESRLLVGLGLVSYSLYLWHWPFLAFWDYLNKIHTKSLAQVGVVVLMALSLGLSYLTWRWIETPLRRRVDGLSRPYVFACAILGMVFLWGIGEYFVTTRGAPDRWSKQALSYLKSDSNPNQLLQGKPNNLAEILNGRIPSFGNQTTNKPPHLLLWGDSHANCLTPALAELCLAHGHKGYLAYAGGTPPLLNYMHGTGRGSLAKDSPRWGEAIIGIIKLQQIRHVVITSSWCVAARKHEAEFHRALLKTIQRIHEAGAEVWLMKDVPSHEFDVPRVLAYHTEFPQLFSDPSTYTSNLEEHRKMNSVLENLTAEILATGAHILDPAPLLSNSEGKTIIVADGKSLYSDGNHITPKGASLLKPLFLPIFTRPKTGE